MKILNDDCVSEMVSFLSRKDRYSLSVISKDIKSKRDEWIKRVKLFTHWEVLFYRWKFVNHLSKLKIYTPVQFRINYEYFDVNQDITNYNNLNNTHDFDNLSQEQKKEIVIKAYIIRDYDFYSKDMTFGEIINNKMGGYKGNMLYNQNSNLKSEIIKLKNKRIKNIYQFYNLFSYSDLHILGW